MGIFNRNKEELVILQKTQENIELSQKNMCMLIDKISDVLDKKYNDEKENIVGDEEKIRVAYALNMCTVSVSQIIDYNDLNILEQEYEVILNNLNLEYMPKDEALLNTLKILLDTITFFRIQEGDKKFIEKEYQQKVRNAIWSAVPNFGLIVAGGNPWSMAISLASQVGCGYMNYRKNKAQNELDKEKSEWQLQRSAMEQFNGIRRELFDAAWRLADKYNFPDKYRLTERKIKQYNSILMDPNHYRRYERLEAIKDNFEAYPPFWYYLGNAASLISQKEEIDIDSRLQYKQYAIEYFDKYLKRNEYALLREDQVLASCCLEYVELLDINSKEKINTLLDKAVEASGDFNDVLQICALYYLKVGSVNSAKRLLKRLVNEDYNATINAQILSKIYVNSYINNKEVATKSDYNILELRGFSEFLFPMPNEDLETPEGLNKEFIEKQRKVLMRKYMLVLEAFMDKYNIKFNRKFPTADLNSCYNDSYFNDSINNHEKRIEDIRDIITNKGRLENYKVRLKESNFSFEILDVLNEIVDSISFLDCMDNEEDQTLIINVSIKNNRANLNELQSKINDNVFGEAELNILSKITFRNFTELYFDGVAECIKNYVNKKNKMDEFSYAEQNLREFCINERISEPDILFKRSEEYQSIVKIKKRHFTESLLGEKAIEAKKEVDYTRQMINAINESKDDVILNSENISVFVKGDNKFDIYMTDKNIKCEGDLRKKIIAIFKDSSFVSEDIIFTRTGVVLSRFNFLKAEVKYDDITYYETSNSSLKIKGKYKNKNLEMSKLLKLFNKLAGYVSEEEIRYKSKLSEQY